VELIAIPHNWGSGGIDEHGTLPSAAFSESLASGYYAMNAKMHNYRPTWGRLVTLK
jgi:hypothetical protein